MKKIILLSTFCVSMSTSFAQPIPHQSIEDSVIGWMKVYNFKGVKTGMKVDDKVYSANQISICDSFVNWMQASYLPKGGLGDAKKSVREKLGLYNQHTAGKPQSYGAYANTYTFLKYNSSRKMVPENNLGIWWGINANGIPGDWPVRDICTPTQYYFTMPTAETEVDDEKIKKMLDLKNNANIKPYISFWVKNMGFGGGTENVILSKDNRSPFIKITRAEYLQALETSIPLYYEKEKKKISEARRGNQRDLEFFLKQLDEKIEGFNTGLKKNREKYKNRMGELAMTSAQPGLADLSNGRDVFSSQYLTDPESNSERYPVYKVDPAMAELCKKDKPQWILVSWDYYAYDPTEKQQHEAIISNFNFEYVYNFFFDPEKVKGLSYKPLRSPYTKEITVVTEASEASKKNTADKNIHYFEDFSAIAIGKKPGGWRVQYGLDGGTVEKPEGLNGNWLLITNNTITATQIKKPFPQNFTLTYDVVASQNFTWGAKGLTFQLSKETSPGNAESFLNLKLRPGFDGKDGETTLESKFPAPPGYSNGTKWYAAPGFSNNKTNNRITVTIKKKEEMLQVFIDNTKIAEYEKAIPAAHLFNAMSFSSGNSGGNDKFYISNIKITKD
ncbi:MAG: hypothetical protein HZB42_05025 [Sphingobacteriales bacterium]|nr:hypothetical protein [Sphingobacteriales bacterium]